MSDDTLIDDLVRAGVSAELIGRVARLQVVLGCLRTSADAVAERRLRDAARKRQKRREIKRLPEANDAGERPRTSADTALSRESFLSSLSESESLKRKKEEPKKAKKESVERGRRGSRIAPDARISDQDFEFSRRLGARAREIEKAWEEFVDYWIAVPGQRGVKLDWSATWRNNARKVLTRGRPNGKRDPTMAAFDDLIDRAERGEIERDAGPPDIAPGRRQGR